MRPRELVVGVEGTLKHVAGNDIFNLRANKSGAFAGLNVLEIDNDPNAAVDLDGYAFTELTCTDHGNFTSGVR
ncbi:hypothetical protein SDC9_190624 [bioreactor metagenome]|uniref:Uncharacterized protein n=1 Tax=bioreactor metagenome TaxID=1076179 RepID=A0A645HVH8_9ZZZZ